MAVVRQVAIPLADYASGTRQLGPFSLPDSAKTLYFEFARCTSADLTIWPDPTTRLQFEFEGSTDGVLWIPAGGFGALGGIHVNRDGSEASLTTVVVPLPALVNRQVRANIEIINGPLRTQGAFEMRD